MMTILLVILYNLVVLFGASVEGTNVGTFKEGTCSKSLDNYNGPNGYPDGMCTPLHLEPQQSFQVVGLDQGCAVTIYGADADPAFPCSSETKIVAQLAQCYNSTWVYYSIDGCDIPSTIPSSSATQTPEPTSSALSSSTTTFISTFTPTSTAAATSAPAASPSRNTGVIVGSIVGGVSFLAIIFIVALYFLRRQYRSWQPPLPPPPSYELSHDAALTELSSPGYPKYPEKVAETELYSHEHAAEIGRNSMYFPPAELPGDSLVGQDKKGINPLIKLHLVP